MSNQTNLVIFLKNMNYSLSVIIITTNEGDRIDQCLKSVEAIADEIIVFDSGSPDRTIEIIKKYTTKVFQTDWPGYGLQKQHALEKSGCQWVLSIDADEVLSLALSDEIHRVLSSKPAEIGFKLPRALSFFGKTLNYEKNTHPPIKLFRRKGAAFTPAVVNEKLLLPEGSVNTLKAQVLHYMHHDFGRTLLKNTDNAWLCAKNKYAEGKKCWGLFTAASRAAWVFLHIFLIRGGFFDGSAGFLTAAIYSQNTFNKYAGLWVLYRNEKFRKYKAAN